ncbi:hypothetical protein E2C01_045362 [Portunus trituberculatus]|uniref:Uncharacterized protein n=1 Tax=Portunus trituberculatus TaxID=210409 RepID=A0A5B7G4U8_PORTR|nr:hypothetical protein [Portunus trituberculatus]
MVFGLLARHAKPAQTIGGRAHTPQEGLPPHPQFQSSPHKNSRNIANYTFAFASSRTPHTWARRRCSSTRTTCGYGPAATSLTSVPAAPPILSGGSAVIV